MMILRMSRIQVCLTLVPFLLAPLIHASRQTRYQGRFAFVAPSKLRNHVFKTRTNEERPASFPLLREADNNEINKDTENDKVKKTATTTSFELFQKEEEASRKVMGRLLLPNRLDQVGTAAAWAVILFGFALNLFGYDYVIKDGQLTIDTIDARQFEKEIRKSTKSNQLSPLGDRETVSTTYIEKSK